MRPTKVMIRQIPHQTLHCQLLMQKEFLRHKVAWHDGADALAYFCRGAPDNALRSLSDERA
jgi:hypothetical protein